MPSAQLIGQSAWAQELRERIGLVAGVSSSVLITGPSGTGKELLARTIHAESPRAAHPFVAVDCTVLTGELFASHLFGHVKGAFTGAHSDRLGCFRAADGGTILLDEIGELGGELQARLLRVLQEREVVPVGSEQPHKVDVRVIAATNRDLREEVRSGRFRLDLYYRLNVVAFATLALRERIEEIEPLANFFLEQLATLQGFPRKRFSAAALAAMRRYAWPGNVRELQNFVERAVIFSPADVIEPCDFPVARDDSLVEMPVPTCEKPLGSADPLPADQDEDWRSLAEMERVHIQQTLARTHYNQSAAAQLLGIDRASLARKIKRFGIALPTARAGRPRKALPPSISSPSFG
ncbi:MAG: sigma-54 dependent transcriptional regulator [Singulisphaera sp.]